MMERRPRSEAPSHDEQLRLVAEAARAPSAHNTQPARFHFTADGGVELWEDTGRWLPVGDPHHKDARISLGMAFEGLALALSTRGLRLGEPELEALRSPAADGADPDGPVLRRVATARLQPGGAPDPLAGQVAARRTFRGEFATADAADRRHLLQALEEAEGALVVEEPSHLEDWAEVHDRASLDLLAGAAYRRELFEWLRWTPRHADWNRDGLSADCLAVTPWEASLARWAMRPPVLGAALRLGFGKLLVSEAAAVRSAAALAVLHQAPAADPFEAGRDWYRLWLRLTAEGFHLCPLSALADTPRGRRRLEERFPKLAGRRVVNVLRIGRLPAGVEPGSSRRLPPEELLLGEVGSASAG